MSEIHTFGCRLNTLESEAIRAAVGEAENLVVFNTCAVTGEAVRQARQGIRRIARERPLARIAVTGCAAQADPDLFAAMPEVHHVLGNALKADARAWRDLRSDLAARVNVPAQADRGPLPAHGATADGRTRAFLQVQTGCDHACTFCIIPQGRGVSRSAAPADVIARARTLVDGGAKEIVLTGVDITSYGQDGGSSLGVLVQQVLRALPELARLRLSSVDCIELDADLMRAFAQEERLMPHLHLSLQAGDDLVLKRMKRRHLRADAIALCGELRRLRPDVVFGADFITGFPTEDEAMFARTLDLVESCGLTHLHVFPFSPRPGTPAARMPQVPREIARARAAQLREAGAQALARHHARQVGRRLRVLTERGGLGRAEDFTLVRMPGAAPGALREVVATGYDATALTLS